MKTGDIVDASSASLLEKLHILPFKYGMKVLHVYDDGDMLDKELVGMTPGDYAAKFQSALRNV